MDTPAHDSEIQEALAAIQGYLSDNIAPLGAAEYLDLLIGRPAGILASEIQTWISSQYQDQETGGAISGYIFHALKKLHTVGQLGLVSENSLIPYLQNLSEVLLEFCPDAERSLLKKKVENLGQAETVLAAPVALIHQQVDPEADGDPSGEESEPADAIDDEVREAKQHDRRFDLLLERLERETPTENEQTAALEEGQEELVTSLLATAAEKAKTGSEFRQLQESLQKLGIEAGLDEVFRKLGGNLPDWKMPQAEGADDSPASDNRLAEAMGRIVRLADDEEEGSKRFEVLVRTAIEQFNEGSTARAATILELADRITPESELDGNVVDKLKKTAHGQLDPERLKSLAEDPEKHPEMRWLLGFFDELKPERLLDNLDQEPKRDQRRLILNLLQVHGEAARESAADRLGDLLKSEDFTNNWYFPRNLIYLLHRIGRSDDADPVREIGLLEPFLMPDYPAPLVKEVITGLGQVKHENAEQLLLTFLAGIEERLLTTKPSQSNLIKLHSILDHLIFVLAHYGTPQTLGAVLDHGLQPDEKLGDTFERLSYLSAQNFSDDPENLERLLKALRAQIPVKFIGVMTQKRAQNLTHLVKALSSSPARTVRQGLLDIAQRFPREEPGKTAARAVEGFDRPAPAAVPQSERLKGDLELFGLPELLQQLDKARASGVLRIKDRGGTAVGSISILDGKFLSARAGKLENETAVYQLLEKPVPATFVLLGWPAGKEPKSREEKPPGDLVPIIREGMRRFDELQRARSLVPDGATLKQIGTEPEPHADETVSAIFQDLWIRACSGAGPEECESHIAADAFTIRSLLARWVVETRLAVQ